MTPSTDEVNPNSLVLFEQFEPCCKTERSQLALLAWSYGMGCMNEQFLAWRTDAETDLVRMPGRVRLDLTVHLIGKCTGPCTAKEAVPYDLKTAETP